MKRVVFLVGGLGWLLLALGFGYIAIQYYSQGAGLQVFLGALSAGGVLFGMIHVVGLVLAGGFCLVLAIVWSAQGLVPFDRQPPADHAPEKPLSRP